MPELIRTITVSIEVDTNKKTREETLTWGSDESYDEFKARIATTLDEMTEVD